MNPNPAPRRSGTPCLTNLAQRDGLANHRADRQNHGSRRTVRHAVPDLLVRLPMRVMLALTRGRRYADSVV